MKAKVDVLVISLTSPLLVGLYQNSKCIKEISSSGQTTQALPLIFKEILENYSCERIFYTKGPGSFMAIKASYVFLKTLQISLNIPFYASDGFAFNQNTPIKSVGNQWFVKENNDIFLRADQALLVKEFELPPYLDVKNFSENTAPLYVLPAV